jgi:hypothetical protein
MSEWLDTETKAILDGVPPSRLAPPDAVGFTLVLLAKSNDPMRLREALAKVRSLDSSRWSAVLAGECPQIVGKGLALDDAILGQFELACCDSAAVFLRDEIVADDDRDYLCRLYMDLLRGEEFELVTIELQSVPFDDRGRRFLRQFLGSAAAGVLVQIGLPLRQAVMRKKARIMRHWGREIGADVRMEAGGTSPT